MQSKFLSLALWALLDLAWFSLSSHYSLCQSKLTVPHSSFLRLCSSCFLCWKYYPHPFSIPLPNPNPVHSSTLQNHIKVSPSKTLPGSPRPCGFLPSSDPQCLLDALVPLCLHCFMTILTRKTHSRLRVECRSGHLVTRKSPFSNGNEISPTPSSRCFKRGTPLPRKSSPRQGPPPQPISDRHSWDGPISAKDAG